MAIVRWEPNRELSSLQSEMNRLFSSVFDVGNGARLSRWAPAMDLIEADDHFVLKADLPGLTEKDVKIELEDSVLTISGERKEEQKTVEEGYYRLERGYGSFSRSLTLPKGTKGDGVEANFNHGVLEVRIPKTEVVKPRRIEISPNNSKKD